MRQRRYLIGCLLSGLLLLGCEQKSTLTPALSLEGEGVKAQHSNASVPDAMSSPLPKGQIRQERIWSSEARPEGGGQEGPTTKGRVRVLPARRIVSLTPGLTELIYAVGAEQWLLATVAYADYPEAAKKIPRIGDAFHVDMEQLLALKPDLVLVWTSGTPATTVDQIKALGLRVESIDVQHLNEVGASLLRVGELTGMQANARAAAQSFEQGVQRLREQYAGRTQLRTFVEVNRQPLYTVNGKHVLSEVLELCGGVNVFAELNQLAPIVAIEAVLNANPDVILSTEGTAAQVRQDWQAWTQVKAVAQQHIYAVSPDTTTRATPRLLQGAEEICSALQKARG